MTKNISDNNFQAEVLDSTLPVLVDFSASWCGPCRAMAPVIDKLSEEFEDKIKVVKLDIDEAPEIAQKYEIRAVPTFVFVEEGREVSRLVGGGISQDQFREKFVETFKG